MAIHFAINEEISTEQFIHVLNRSTSGARRPIGDRELIAILADQLANLVEADFGVAASALRHHAAAQESAQVRA